MPDTTLRDYARQTAAYVAENLGQPGDWSPDTSDTYAFHDGRVFLNGPAGARLLLTFGGHAAKDRDRLRVRGFLPRGYNTLPYELRHADHEIGMSREKGPATIALEITRRLLPAYLLDVEAAHEYIRQASLDAESRNATVESLRRAFKANRADENRVWVSHPQHEWYGDLTVNHDGSRVSSLELRGLTPGQVETIAALLVGR